MIGFLSNLIFLNPWILAGLISLPLLWVLLRITPPTPRLIVLPTTRFLEGLIPESQTPSHTPWWILMLRLLIAALVLIALARPVYNPAGELPGSGPIRLVMDNSWASAQIWDEQIKAASETISQAGRENRDIYILTTAPQPGTDKPLSEGPLSEGQASAILKGLEPFPWPTDYKQITKLIDEPAYNFWYSHGLKERGFEGLFKKLTRSGLSYITPKPEQLPLLLNPPDKRSYDLEIAVNAPKTIPENLPVNVQALAEDGRVLDTQSITLNPETLPQTVAFDIPEVLRGEIGQFRIANNRGSGGIFILDERFRKRSVGIVGAAENADTKPFIEASYYLKRALEPFTTLHFGSAEEILEQNPSMMILPDIGSMPAGTLNKLEGWVKDGGLLLRFAGPTMVESQSQPFLLPIPLRPSGRSTGGTLAWETPPKLSEFPEHSPFYGIEIHDEVEVRQQALAEPLQDLEQKTWAQLDDGTPLITADTLDKGLLVMIHTTASADWSDLALSGLYVEILRRLVSISGTTGSTQSQADGFLQAEWVFDGFGAIESPGSWVQSIAANEFAKTPTSAIHPPGLYGRGGYNQALNLGDHIKSLQTAVDIPQSHYGNNYEHNLMPYVLYAALVLLLVDWLVMILLMIGIKPLMRFASVALIFFALPAHAQDNLQYANGLYLAYIKSGNPSLDATTHKGLENLSAILKRRTSIEPSGVAGLNPETDTLVFFPLIYWPISNAPLSLSNKALQNIQHYLNHGGTILFDTRDQNYAASALTGTKNSAALRHMIGNLNIPPLGPINDNHVLGRSFYLLDTFPGRFSGGTLWVEQLSANGRDGVSSVIIGSHDWGGAWATGRSNRSSLRGGSRQQELAYRFGVNAMMYALTGNYKADQVHVPHILERLGQ